MTGDTCPHCGHLLPGHKPGCGRSLLFGTQPGYLAPHEIRHRLARLVDQLDLMAARVTATAETLDVDPIGLQLPSGELALVPILVAQAQVLTALAALEKR